MKSLIFQKISSVQFDVQRLADEYLQLEKQHSMISSSRGASVLRAYSLTHRKNASDPLFDGSNSQFHPQTKERLYEETEFSEFNSDFKDTYFYEVYQKVPYLVGRVRLIKLPPLTVYKMHIDSSRRAHIPIITNPNCFILFQNGSSFHLPADGSLYELDTTIPHTAVNCSDEDRIHLVMSIIGAKDP